MPPLPIFSLGVGGNQLTSWQLVKFMHPVGKGFFITICNTEDPVSEEPFLNVGQFTITCFLQMIK